MFHCILGAEDDDNVSHNYQDGPISDEIENNSGTFSTTLDVEEWPQSKHIVTFTQPVASELSNNDCNRTETGRSKILERFTIGRLNPRFHGPIIFSMFTPYNHEFFPSIFYRPYPGGWQNYK